MFCMCPSWFDGTPATVVRGLRAMTGTGPHETTRARSFAAAFVMRFSRPLMIYQHFRLIRDVS